MEEMVLDPFAMFGQETYEDAVKKNNEENKSFAKTKHFKIDSEGTYPVRILPIAPTKVGETWVLDRKGYEYPIKSHILKIENPNQNSKKNALLYVNVCHTSYVGISVDLIDTYIEVAESMYGNNEDLMKKIKSGSFDGGLKWNYQRCMYVLDYKKRSEGIQLLTISYSQYKELEERKLGTWQKLIKSDSKHACPISSLNKAYPVEIVRKKEGKKVSYTLNVDVLSGYDVLSEEEVTALMEAPRLPEVLYRYSRFHLEATIEFLKQYDAKMEMSVMNSQEIKDTIQKISMELPADDKSHFKFESGKAENENAASNKLDDMWDTLEKIEEDGLGEKSEEYQELRDAIRQYIDDNNLPVRVTRSKTNKDLLEAIEDALDNDNGNDSNNEDEEESGNNSSNESSNEDEEDDALVRGEHNDDTNEPARRTERAARRRVR